MAAKDAKDASKELQALNPLITCKICGGYFIDATTVTECLHTFCRSCIVKHFKKSLFCPECDVQVERGCPLNKLRPDPRKQLLVYKIVPRLHQNEVARQWNFIKKIQPNYYGPRLLLPGDLPEETIRDRIVDKIHVYSPEDKISLSVEFESESPGGLNGVNTHKRYLQCPAALTMYHLKKFIRLKYDLSNMYKITICYEGEPLPDNMSLMDVAYQFFYEPKSPMRFTYRVCVGAVSKAAQHVSVKAAPAPTAAPVAAVAPVPVVPVVPVAPVVAVKPMTPVQPITVVPPTEAMAAVPRHAPRGSVSSHTGSSDEGSTTTSTSSYRRQQRQRSAKTAAYSAIEAMDESDHEEEVRAKRGRRTPGKSPRWEAESPEPYTVYRRTRSTPRSSLDDFEARYSAKAGRRVYATAFSDDELSDPETKRNTLANAMGNATYSVARQTSQPGRKPKSGKRGRKRNENSEDVYEFNSQNEDNEDNDDSNTTQEFDFVYDNSDHESAGSDRRQANGVADSTEGVENNGSVVDDVDGDVDADEHELEQQIEMEVVTDNEDIDQHIEDAIEEVEVDADDEQDNEAENTSCLVIAEDEEDDGVVEEVIAAEEDGHELVVVEDPEEGDVTYTVEVVEKDSPTHSVSSKSPTVEEDEPEIVHEKVFRKKSKKSKHHHHHHHHKRKRHHSPVMLISSPEEAPMKLTLKLRPTPSISPSAAGAQRKSPLPESPNKEKKVTFVDTEKIYTVKITSPKVSSPTIDSAEKKFAVSNGDASKSPRPSSPKVPEAPKGGGNQPSTASPKAAATYPAAAPKSEDSDKTVPEEAKERLTQMRQVRIKPPAPSPPASSSVPDLKSVKTPSSLTISKVEAGEAPPRTPEPSNKPALEILMLPPSPPPTDSASEDGVASSEPPAKKPRTEAKPLKAPKADTRPNPEQQCVLDLSDKTKRELSPKPQVSSTTPSPVPKAKPASPPREISVRSDLGIVPGVPSVATPPDLGLMTNPQLLTIQTLFNEATLATMHRMNGFLGTSQVPLLNQVPPKQPMISPFPAISAANAQPQRRLLPTLTDIYASRRVSGFTMPASPVSRPGPNQSVRHIPNPSALLHRQHSLHGLQHGLQHDKLDSKQQGQLTEQQLKERYQQFQQNRAAKAAYTYSRATSAPAPSPKKPSACFAGVSMSPPSSAGSMQAPTNNNLVVKTAIRPRSIEKVAGLLSVRAGAMGAYAVEAQVGH
ncbi:protein piccolo-like [Thrips palmi]|uniref:Protein piccolo-like n=1 Tax=Thrips palmi TaxID=161013 RepID=A0A6P8YW78_THRPL|nr:protein piccolo-like [Thrips palmi]